MSPDETAQKLEKHPLVLFDGVCGICNFFVDFLDRKSVV